MSDLIQRLLSHESLEVVDPKAVYRTRPVALFEEAAASLASKDEWRDIESAPKGPVVSNPINDFLPGRLGPLVQLTIPFNPPTTTIGFWCPEHDCWRHMADDGPNDIQPTHWKPLDVPATPVLGEGVET